MEVLNIERGRGDPKVGSDYCPRPPTKVQDHDEDEHEDLHRLVRHSGASWNPLRSGTSLDSGALE